jgi:hypothetical protein
MTPNNGNGKSGKRRRMSLFMLGLCMVLIGVIGWQMRNGIQSSRRSAAAYATDLIVQPVKADLCPGEVLQYQQSIHIETTAMVDISREWCKRNGTCDLELHQSWTNAIVVPQDISSLVSRVVPPSTQWKPGGLYEFRSGIHNGKLSVQFVPFSIREDCEVIK